MIAANSRLIPMRENNAKLPYDNLSFVEVPETKNQEDQASGAVFKVILVPFLECFCRGKAGWGPGASLRSLGSPWVTGAPLARQEKRLRCVLSMAC